MPVVDATSTTPQRRVPRQERSRRLVEGILDAAERMVVERGVEVLTTRDIAEGADAPVASLYQYFSDKEDVLLALALRDMGEMDHEVAGDLAELEVLSVSSLVRTTMTAFVSVYRRRPAFVEIYLRGRTNHAVHRFGAEHNLRVAENLRAYAVDAGVATDHLSVKVAQLAVEVGDRVFQLAYLERYATPAGIKGVRR